MISWWWVKYHPKRVEQLTDLNKLYSVAYCWITIANLWHNYAACNNKTYLGLHANCPVFLTDFNRICILSPHFDRSPQYHISRKSVRSDPRPIHVDTRTGMTKLICALRDYANTPKKWFLKGLQQNVNLGEGMLHGTSQSGGWGVSPKRIVWECYSVV